MKPLLDSAGLSVSDYMSGPPGHALSLTVFDYNGSKTTLVKKADARNLWSSLGKWLGIEDEKHKALFVGGPAHGTIREIPAEQVGRPQHVVSLDGKCRAPHGVLWDAGYQQHNYFSMDQRFGGDGYLYPFSIYAHESLERQNPQYEAEKLDEEIKVLLDRRDKIMQEHGV